jgi:predicted O-methyltransferase YrrM
VTFRRGDGGTALADLADGSVDLLFLDAERTEYPAWWPHPMRVLRPGGLLVADNATSHPEEIAPLRALVEAEPGMVTITVGSARGSCSPCAGDGTYVVARCSGRAPRARLHPMRSDLNLALQIVAVGVCVLLRLTTPAGCW